MSQDDNPIYSPFFGVIGASSAMVFSGKYWIQEKLCQQILTEINIVASCFLFTDKISKYSALFFFESHFNW